MTLVCDVFIAELAVDGGGDVPSSVQRVKGLPLTGAAYWFGFACQVIEKSSPLKYRT